MNKIQTDSDLISIIIPIKNGTDWIKSCFESILSQTTNDLFKLEICVCDDASTDNTYNDLIKWKLKFNEQRIEFKIFRNVSETSRGVGYAKNRATELSAGKFLCFQDVDDVMLPNRILNQFNTAIKMSEDTLIGSQFRRDPENSTERYTKWANSLTKEQLQYQIYTANGPTIIMPTWFCHRLLYNRVGGFCEDGQGTPEDLIFFYKVLDLNGNIHRVDECLLIYKYHKDAATFSIKEETIWKLRLKRLENVVLSKWTKFTIWNAGRQGRKFYNSLSDEHKDKVIAFCDIDDKKINRNYVPYNPNKRKSGKRIEVVHFKEATPPFIICVKLLMTNGMFENNLGSLNLIENIDYIYFS